MSRESDVHLLQHDLNTSVANFDDGDGARLHAGAECGKSSATDGGASLHACCGEDADGSAVVSSLFPILILTKLSFKAPNELNYGNNLAQEIQDNLGQLYECDYHPL